MSEPSTPTPTPPTTPENPPPAPGGQPPQGTPPEGGLDWRLLVIVGVAVLFLVAAIINRKYFGQKKAEAPGKQTSPGRPGAPTGPALSPVEAYANLMKKCENDALGMLFTYEGRTLIIASPSHFITQDAPQDRRGPADPKPAEKFVPGQVFDVTKTVEGVRPEMFFRRAIYGEGEGIAFADTFQPLGLPDGPKPEIKAAADAGALLRESNAVIGVAVGDEARAYPVRLLCHHDVVNDTLGGMPIVVAWSALANGVSVMSRALPDGRAATFGSAGLLYQSAIMLYDTGTRSLWSATLRRSMAGPLAGTRLQPVPATLTTWKAWQALHPTTTVMVGADPKLNINYDYNPSVPRSPEGGYLDHLKIYYPVYGTNPEKSSVRWKWMVFGVTGPDGKSTKAYNIRLLAEKQAPVPAPASKETTETLPPQPPPPIEDTIGGQKVTLQLDRSTFILTAKDESGKPLLTECMLWIAWVGAHPDTEIWREKEQRDSIHPAPPTTLPVAPAGAQPNAPTPQK